MVETFSTVLLCISNSFFFVFVSSRDYFRANVAFLHVHSSTATINSVTANVTNYFN